MGTSVMVAAPAAPEPESDAAPAAGLNTRAAVLAAGRAQIVPFEYDGTTYYIRDIGGRNRAALGRLAASCNDDPAVMRWSARFVTMGLCDQAGQRLLTEADMDTLEDEWDSDLLVEMGLAIREQSGLTPGDQGQAEGN